MNVNGSIVTMYSFKTANELVKNIANLNEVRSSASIPKDIADLYGLMKPGGESQLIVVGGRPSMGTSDFCLNMVMHNALTLKKPTMVFSQCCSASRLWRRISAGNVINSVGQPISECDLTDCELYFDDSASLSPKSLRAKLNECIAHEDQPLVFIDSLQEMRSDQYSENRAEELSLISSELAKITRELAVTIIIHSDLDRALESRIDKRPLRDDFRATGSIDLDADLVMSLYRDEIYNQQSERVGKTEIRIHKSRYDLPIMGGMEYAPKTSQISFGAY